MGKTSRKLAKKQQENKADQQNKIILDDKQKIAAYKEDGDYEAALEVVIDLLNRHCYDADVLFSAAELYFMAGDYERTAVWINKTLEFFPGHTEARILLAHTCMLTDRLDDALKILEVVLRSSKEQLNEQEEERIEELLEYFKYTADLGEIKKTYPRIAAFLQLDVEAEAGSDADTTIEEIKEEIKEEIVPGSIIKGEDDPVKVLDETELCNEMTQIKREIAEKRISLRQKIFLYNSFAGGFFFDNRFDEAQELLEEALQIDSDDTETLKNITELCIEQGNKEKALEYVAKLSITDFSLLKKIKAL